MRRNRQFAIQFQFNYSQKWNWLNIFFLLCSKKLLFFDFLAIASCQSQPLPLKLNWTSRWTRDECSIAFKRFARRVMFWHLCDWLKKLFMDLFFYSNSFLLGKFVCVCIWSAHKFNHQKPNADILFRVLFFCSLRFVPLSLNGVQLVYFFFSVFRIIIHLICLHDGEFFSETKSSRLECPKLISKRSHICWLPIQRKCL